MKAAYLNEFGDREVIQVGELPIPTLKDDEVLVKIKAVTINPVDTLIRKGLYPIQHPFPYVISRDAIGVVEEVGAKVKNFKKGMRVYTFSMGYEDRNGVASEFAAIPESRLVAVPEEVTKDEELSLLASLHPVATATILLKNVQKGQSILITGASGHVGKALLRLSVLKGLDAYTTSHPKKFGELKELGAKETYSYGETFEKDIPQTFDYVIDTSGKVSLATQIDLLEEKGQVFLITTPKEGQAVDYTKFYQNSKKLTGFVISKASLDELQQAATEMNYCFKQGELFDNNYHVYPLEEAAICQQQIEDKLERKRTILKINN